MSSQKEQPTSSSVVSIATRVAFGLMTARMGAEPLSLPLIPKGVDRERLLLPAKMKIPTRIRKTRRYSPRTACFRADREPSCAQQPPARRL